MSTPTRREGSRPDRSLPDEPVDVVETRRHQTMPSLPVEEALAMPRGLQWRLLTWYRTAARWDEASALLDAIDAEGRAPIRVLEERAKLHLAIGRPDEARAALEARLRLSPNQTARIALARLLIEIGESDAAAAIVADLERAGEAGAGVALLAADLALARGDAGTARERYEALLAAEPEQRAPMVGLARLAARAGDVAAAVDWIDRALALPSTPTDQTLLVLAGLLDVCGRSQRAALLRERAVAAAIADRLDFSERLATALGRSDGRRADAEGQLVSFAAPSHGNGNAKPTDLAEEGDLHPAPAPAEAGPAVEPEPEPEPRVLEVLRDVFGHDALRPGQARVIANVLAGRDTLAVLPTGAGKSLTFQLPALLLGGTTLVMSPLIALMKDQVEGLPPALRERTAFINSSLGVDEQRRVLDGIADGAYKLVYAAPERLRSAGFVRAMRRAGVGLVVVDEAHCISLWGHDFRPDYLGIPAALPSLGNPPVLAITATATPRMAQAIAAGFGRPLAEVRASVFRPNLFYEVRRLANRDAKLNELFAVARGESGPGIVYVSSRRDADQIATLLRQRGVAAVSYHAGMEKGQRERNQNLFMRGQVRTVVATVAFGMGVDKPDVRWIVHFSPSTSLEAYAQESGRAGRDGLPARCILLATPADRQNLGRLVNRDATDLETLRRVYAHVRRAASGRWAILDPSGLVAGEAESGDPDEAPDPRIAVNLLVQAKLLHRHPDAPVGYTLHRQPRGVGPVPALEPEQQDPWDRFAAWAGLDEPGAAGTTIVTADACAALGCTPVALAALLSDRPDLAVVEGPRLPCLEVLPAGDDPRGRLETLIAQTRAAAEERVARVVGYAAGRSCRHVALARHLGERLEPCGASCDVCAGTTSAAPAAETRRPASKTPTSADALAILAALPRLPFALGKTGLTRVLAGAADSPVRADRSPLVGSLSHLSKSAITGLIDRLVAAGFLRIDTERGFPLLALTQRGQAATEEDLGEIAIPARPAAAGSADVDGAIDAALLQRLHAWRKRQAAEDAVPAYVVAPNKALEEVARVRPTSPEALERVAGFGPSRVERYGDAILALVRETDEADE